MWESAPAHEVFIFRRNLRMHPGRSRLPLHQRTGFSPPTRHGLSRGRQQLDLVARLQGQDQVLGKGTRVCSLLSFGPTFFDWYCAFRENSSTLIFQSMEFQPDGFVSVELRLPDGTKEVYRWNKITTCIHNLFRSETSYSRTLHLMKWANFLFSGFTNCII